MKRSGRSSTRPLAGILALLFAGALLSACVSAPKPSDTGTPLSMQRQSDATALSRAGIERELAKGTPASLAGALGRVEADRTLTPSDAALYRWYAVELGRIAYPEKLGTSPVVPDPPSGHPWARAFADARTGRIAPPRDGADPLELLALACAVFRGESKDTCRSASLALDLFGQSGLESPLAEHLRGVLAERSGDYSVAQSRYISAFVSAPDCYPALFGAARTLIALGRSREAVDILTASRAAYETDFGWVRLMALSLYDSGRYDESGPYVTAVLRQDPLDSQILLLRADMLIRAGEYRQAQPLLDAYASVDASNRRYLLLRGRVAWEGSHNREDALRYLRKLLSLYPEDAEASLVTARILALGNISERNEAYALAGRVLTRNPADTGALRILLGEDVRRREWTSAQSQLDKLRVADPEYKDRAVMHLVYRATGRFEDAFRTAAEWRNAEPESEDALLAYIRSLIDRKDVAAARELMARALTGKGSSRFRSGLYYLQSLLQPNDETALNSLRSSLVENVQNLDALTAMYDIYMRQKDPQKARFYLRQALAVAPEDPGLARRREDLLRLGLAP